MTRLARYGLVLGAVAFFPGCYDVCSQTGGLNSGQCEAPPVDPGEPPVGGCQSIDNPSVTLAAYTQFMPEQKRNNPEAGEPEYVYLAAGREAVVVDGPSIMNAGPLQLISPGIFLEGQRDTSADGYNVVVNEEFGYEVRIDDFEYEVTLARVELCQKGNVVDSRFIFAASPDGDGVAHDVKILPVILQGSGTPITGSSPVTIEVR